MKKFHLSILAIGMLVLGSCTKYPDESTRLLEDLVVYSQYDVNVNFADYKTFAIVDSLGYQDANDSGRVLTPNAKAILDRITSNMIDRGFVQVAHNAIPKPDLAIDVDYLKTTEVDVYYPGYYWGGYYNPYYWGYGGYYYGYPYYPSYVSSYSAGSVFIDLFDLKYPTTDNKLYTRWSVYIRGLYTDAHTTTEINKSIDQAFTQTPSLKTSSN
jgi:hypothetical protein